MPTPREYDDEILDDAPKSTAKEPAEDDFAALLEQHLPGGEPRQAGELVDATVVRILDDVVLVDYGFKAECAVPLREFQDGRGEVLVRPGESVRLVLLGTNSDGTVDLSFAKARAAEAARMLREAAAAGVPVRGIVARAVKGGLLVDVGMPAFMPASQADTLRITDFDALVGQEIEALVLEYDEERQRAVLSRRKLLEQRRDRRRDEFLRTVEPGATLRGVVRDVLDFGVFVALDGAEGLIPRSELSYERGVTPADLFTPGDEIDVKVLDVSAENGRLTLSRKRLDRDPWETIDETFPVGSIVKGKVVETKDFGAFVQLQEGLTGLLHAGDIAWDTTRRAAGDHFRPGDEVTCQVTAIDRDRKRLSLSLKHLSRDPWLDIEARFPIGSRHRGVVASVRDFGAFIRLEDGTEGLLHIGDLSWTERVKHPSDVLAEGQELEVAVVKLDIEKRRIGLGLKQLEASPLERFRREHKVGSLVTGKVTRLVPFGAFVELAPGIEGMMHISEIDEVRVEAIDKALRVGQEVTVKVLKIEADRGRIALSRRQALREAEREAVDQYRNTSKQSLGGSLFGDALRSALEKK
ncbi:MAG: S1 RNA-binding domain-containing protein [Candidatus Sumerlaeia bacterium]|nr:S1 RNA-binding domain-containing protein [Candidatus Sumerlaeia bacterium]